MFLPPALGIIQAQLRRRRRAAAWRGSALLHSLTPTGRSVLEQGLEIAQRINEESFENLTQAERAQLLTLVRKAIA
ncbi:hypothetical protein GN109_24215 [Collimonas pratensis]|uniref:hypothetical protein n=1 Tax=Collimonas pratensis TaxID=279113 RepID=UPI00143D893D|nr:hypothetical protein [Collimonas pratensis]NKI72528.1 hypothetical protein [Collimonas pratensis]